MVGVLGSQALELMFVFFSKKWGLEFRMMIKSFFDGLFVLGG